MSDSAVLFIVFNRPEKTSRVFDAIRKARPSRLYVAADGPRSNKEGEAEKVEKVRQICNQVDWDCQVHRLYRDQNLGCKIAVSSAIDWFFRQEEQGIILEDDCLPHPDFFRYCSEALGRYKDDPRIFSITGTNIQDGYRRGDASYYFSKYAHVWGWATWRRAWTHYQIDMDYWPTFKSSREWRRRNFSLLEMKCWNKVFNLVYQNKVDTWDYQWTACHFYKNSLVVTPNVNLISNIGYGDDATHTKGFSADANRPTASMGMIKHPDKVEQNIQADMYEFEHTFGSKYMGIKNVWRVIAKIILE
jgi:hypothetical protein